ncbi:MAG TPA: lipoprotein-releasing system ATP-binding protein LolD [Bacteroidetes bacterium]|nr:lipoprotein-releasing system ATP-binding protein LolD [Bacteroidota bacterium]
MLSAQNIHKSYNTLSVLNGIDMTIEAKEVVSIVGSSGAGKSTLLQILGTLEKPDQGEVTFEGQRISSLSGKELARFRNEKIGFVFQFHHLLPEFSALENVCIPAMLQGISQKKASFRASELLEKMGLSERIKHRPSELSGGEQQRVAVARALMNKPAIVFADEPSGNLDAETSEELHDLIFSLRATEEQSFVIVTHDLDFAKKADRMLTLDKGKLV